MHTNHSLIDAIDALWKMRPPPPDNLWSSPEYNSLKVLLVERYENGCSRLGLDFALDNALRSLGLPCLQFQKPRYPTLKLDEVASALTHGFSQTKAVRRYLCPLDLADEIPCIIFGSTKLAKFTPKELEGLFEAPRLARHFPLLQLDTARLSEFHWLVVEEEVAVKSPWQRGFSSFDIPVGTDLGIIKPYGGRFPDAVESALFFLLLAPWERWAEIIEVDWRGFQLPWIYTVNEDLFVKPTPPPDPSDLTWGPHPYTDVRGEHVEYESPITLRLHECARSGIQALTDTAWSALQYARKLDLFKPPVEHFLVRAFLAGGIDEVLAHMIAIEAALGTESDHNRSLRPKTDPHKGLSASKRVAARLCAALGDPKAGEGYLKLFKQRSLYVHGRADLKPISTNHRVLARSLARGAAEALVSMSSQGLSRDVLLAKLLDSGA